MTTAKTMVPAELTARSDRVDVAGLGAGTQGRTSVLGQSLAFTRSASRLSLFDDLQVSDRGVGAVEINGTRPVLLLPAGDAALRQRLLQASLALALLWDPAGAP